MNQNSINGFNTHVKMHHLNKNYQNKIKIQLGHHLCPKLPNNEKKRTNPQKT
jgi:hypothetical protein